MAHIPARPVLAQIPAGHVSAPVLTPAGWAWPLRSRPPGDRPSRARRCTEARSYRSLRRLHCGCWRQTCPPIAWPVLETRTIRAVSVMGLPFKGMVVPNIATSRAHIGRLLLFLEADTRHAIWICSISKEEPIALCPVHTVMAESDFPTTFAHIAVSVALVIPLSTVLGGLHSEALSEAWRRARFSIRVDPHSSRARLLD